MNNYHNGNNPYDDYNPNRADNKSSDNKELNNKAKSKAVNHEYYMNSETTRNRLFDTYTGKQNEDFHLDLAHPNGVQGESENEHIIHNKKRGVSDRTTGNKESCKQ